MIRRLALSALCLAALVLGGCIVSESFLLDGSKAVKIVATGKQTSLQPGKPSETIEVTPQADGWYLMSAEKSEPIRMIFIPIPGQKDRFFMAVGDMGSGDKPGMKGFMYGVGVRAEGKIGFDMADCGQKSVNAIAKRNGAQIDDIVCSFKTPAGLTRTLTELAKTSRPIDKLPTLPALP